MKYVFIKSALEIKDGDKMRKVFEEGKDGVIFIDEFHEYTPKKAE